MLPTTTTTTLFLPDSRARMRERVQEKNKIERSEKQSILKTFKHDVAFFCLSHYMTLMLCFCMVVHCDLAQVLFVFFVCFLQVCVQPSQRADHAMSMS